MKRLLVATTNAGKLRELTPLLSGFGFSVVGLADFPAVPEAIEDGDSFAANALLKAKHYRSLTGVATLADDSGLEVRALHGRPGVHSARFAGPDATDVQNNARLLEQMDAQPDRAARFVCSLCLLDGDDDADALQVEGFCPGTILAAARGDEGFGYDPLFLPDEQPTSTPRTFAQMTREEKRALSHRGHALTALFAELEARGLTRT